VREGDRDFEFDTTIVYWGGREGGREVGREEGREGPWQI